MNLLPAYPIWWFPPRDAEPHKKPSARMLTGRRARKRAEFHASAAFQGCDYTDEELEFLRAIRQWKFEHPGKCPTPGEILRIARLLGYRKMEGSSNGPP